MADEQQPHPTPGLDEERASQQVHPSKPARDDAPPEGEPNEPEPGRPQHEPSNPDAADW